MKNIYLLPTKKPSKLVKIYNDVNRETFTLKLNVEVNDSFKEYVNVYITSDEEIKDVRPHKGKWHLEKENILNKLPDYLTDLSECKLVIMTTDDDLINDGVQSIDDEFLEWFVKNPSCEWVEVVDGIYFDDVEWISCYKIIIPKEKVIEDWNEFQHLDDEGITVKEFLENQKQETLEEFSRRRFNEQKLDTYTSYNIEDAIKEGAKSDAAKAYWYNIFKQNL